MLETVIADAAQKMIDMENSQNMVISQFYELLQEETTAEAKAAKESNLEKAANDRIVFIEEFNDTYEVGERRRDMAVKHAAHEAAEFEEEVGRDVADQKKKLMDREEKLERQIANYKSHEEVLKADLREIQQIVRDKLLEEWEMEQKKQGLK